MLSTAITECIGAFAWVINARDVVRDAVAIVVDAVTHFGLR